MHIQLSLNTHHQIMMTQWVFNCHPILNDECMMTGLSFNEYAIIMLRSKPKTQRPMSIQCTSNCHRLSIQLSFNTHTVNNTHSIVIQWVFSCHIILIVSSCPKIIRIMCASNCHPMSIRLSYNEHLTKHTHTICIEWTSNHHSIVILKPLNNSCTSHTHPIVIGLFC